MPQEIIIEPMTEHFIVWRCLHGGPLSLQSIDRWPSDSPLAWETYRARNLPLLRKLVQTYGTCAFLARDGDQVVGQLRFYPQAILSLEEAGELCLQQDFPAGCTERLVEKRFPPLEEIEDKTLVVHCMMTGSPHQRENPYQRKGIGTRLATALIAWAKEKGWEQIETGAFEDLPILYAFTGGAGERFLGEAGVQRRRHKDRARVGARGGAAPRAARTGSGAGAGPGERNEPAYHAPGARLSKWRPGNATTPTGQMQAQWAARRIPSPAGASTCSAGRFNARCGCTDARRGLAGTCGEKGIACPTGGSSTIWSGPPGSASRGSTGRSSVWSTA